MNLFATLFLSYIRRFRKEKGNEIRSMKTKMHLNLPIHFVFSCLIAFLSLLLAKHGALVVIQLLHSASFQRCE